MAPMPSLKFNFTIPQRGAAKTWSTKMHFSGGVPSGDAAWQALFDDISADLQAGIMPRVINVGATGYANDTSPAVWTQPSGWGHGTCTDAADEQTAIVCALMSWTTDARNSRGGPIYLRNFIHGTDTGPTSLEEVVSGQKAALQVVAAKFDAAGAGYTDGTNTYHRAGPNGVVGQVGTCEENVSRRVLARRG